MKWLEKEKGNNNGYMSADGAFTFLSNNAKSLF